MTSGEGDVTQWIGRLAHGDDQAAGQIWGEYFEKLVAIARRKLEAMPRRSTDEEDVALSAMHSFCRGLQQGRFQQLADRHDLWKLLVTITARKAYRQIRSARTTKRGGGKVRGESVFDHQEPLVFSKEPTPEFANIVAENCQRLLSSLEDASLAQIATYKLEGYTNEEIAEKLGCVLRTVERKLERIRDKWSKDMSR